ncbi:putative Mg2+ transporter-C (MgtC) family protein [Proteiniborus ethanoligenes]|uniref:Putative Mg2+ transporter-C (MgtC) family protein n=1 Tax=Proteiniborus ethanoligenes TaxID=415015 RepID=A0A1H3N6G2_9FIRM|nr:MgtC/SapB family protein [Proteiniborus ethanoligenes]TAH63263.1 MAG: MgtC/SapB family protein [Gottschalkiaceae bacterium]SDY84408.1 putative Mg2+ transporter-C (MgtC) family protein [Proteiniborus ethanoligenes]
MLSVQQIAFRLILSVALSGIIGVEREIIKRPAGLRTHILVCVGSTLVMLTSIHIFYTFKPLTTLQPDRLGAQVISGIGFLGAGTIIRQGDTVRGLTTAASLWAVACIGIAIGAGFYIGAVIAVLLVFITLSSFAIIEKGIKNKRNYLNLKITSINKPGQLGKVCRIVGDLGGNIMNIELEHEEDQMEIINLIIMLPNISVKKELIDKLKDEDGVIEVLNRS